MNNILYKRYLPHIHPAETPLFITFRLYNSICDFLMWKWREELKNKVEYIESMTVNSYKKQYIENTSCISKNLMNIWISKMKVRNGWQYQK